MSELTPHSMFDRLSPNGSEASKSLAVNVGDVEYKLFNILGEDSQVKEVLATQKRAEAVCKVRLKRSETSSLNFDLQVSFIPASDTEVRFEVPPYCLTSCTIWLRNSSGGFSGMEFSNFQNETEKADVRYYTAFKPYTIDDPELLSGTICKNGQSVRCVFGLDYYTYGIDFYLFFNKQGATITPKRESRSLFSTWFPIEYPEEKRQALVTQLTQPTQGWQKAFNLLSPLAFVR